MEPTGRAEQSATVGSFDKGAREMSVERRTTIRTPRPTADGLLVEALKQARLAYQFAPGAYTLGALTAISNAVERLRVEPTGKKGRKG
jgi:hypothetical protein